MMKHKSYTILHDHFSRAWLRFRYRTRSWIHAHGGSTLLIARAIMEPFRSHIKDIMEENVDLDRSGKLSSSSSSSSSAAAAAQSLKLSPSLSSLRLSDRGHRHDGAGGAVHRLGKRLVEGTLGIRPEGDGGHSDVDGAGSRERASREKAEVQIPQGQGQEQRQRQRQRAVEMEWEKVYKKWILVLQKCIRFGGASNGNTLRMYNVGEDFFRDLWHSIDTAKHHIMIETYTIEPDATGLKTLQKLTEARQRGVEVKLIVDAFGSSSMREEHFADLRAAGGEVLIFNPPRLYGFFSTKHWVRTHRKLCIVDTQVGFCGGMNLADQYSGPALDQAQLALETDPDMVYQMRRHNFRDSHVMMTGPCVEDMLNIFLETYEEALLAKHKPFRFKFIPKGTKFWKKLRQKQHLAKKFATPTMQSAAQDTRAKQQQKQQLAQQQRQVPVQRRVPEEVEEEEEEEEEDTGVFVQMLPSHPTRGRRFLHRAVHMAIGESHRNCYITTPYFLPPRSLTNALFRARKNGSDVRILTAGMSDVVFMRLAAIPLYGMFLKKGIRIYEYHGSTLHTKTITSDGFFSSSGSYNLDRLSFYSNMEIGWLALDKTTSETISNHFFEDLKHSKEVTYEDWLNVPWYKRWLGWFFLFLMLVLGP